MLTIDDSTNYDLLTLTVKLIEIKHSDLEKMEFTVFRLARTNRTETPNCRRIFDYKLLVFHFARPKIDHFAK